LQDENSNQQVDTKEELDKAKTKLEDFKIPGLGPESSDDAILVELKNSTGDTAITDTWEQSGANAEGKIYFLVMKHKLQLRNKKTY
jgi:hypothetical protein